MKKDLFVLAVILVIMMMVLSMGCATLGMLADEAAQITAEDVGPQVESIGVLIDGLIPGPYKIPAAVGLGYLCALLRRIYKKKKGCKA